MIGENNRTEANRNISVRMPALLGIVGVRLVAGVDHRPRYCPCAGSLSRGLLTRSFHTDLDDAPRAKHHSARWPLPGIALHIAYAQNTGGKLWIESVLGSVSRCSTSCCQFCSWWPPQRWRKRP